MNLSNPVVYPYSATGGYMPIHMRYSCNSLCILFTAYSPSPFSTYPFQCLSVVRYLYISHGMNVFQWNHHATASLFIANYHDQNPSWKSLSLSVVFSCYIPCLSKVFFSSCWSFANREPQICHTIWNDLSWHASSLIWYQYFIISEMT